MVKHTKKSLEKTSSQVLTSVNLYGGVKTQFGGELGKDRVNYKTIRTARKDPTIALIRTTVISPVINAEWSYEETADAPEGAREFIETVIEPLKVELQRDALLGGLDYGWQSFEKVFDVNDQSQVVPTKIKSLLPDFTEILVDEHGVLTGVRQTANPNALMEVTLDISKTMVVSFDVEGTDWYGQSMLENVLETQERYDRVNEAAARHDDKIAGTHWMIQYPPGSNILNGVETDNAEIANQLIGTLQSSGVIVVPLSIQSFISDLDSADGKGSWIIELMSDTSSPTSQYIDRMRYLDTLKARGFGLPERAVLEGQFGTKAESESQTDLALLGIGQRGKTVAEAVNKSLIDQLLRLNYGPSAAGSVYVVQGKLQDLDKAFLRELYKSVLSNQASFLDEVESIDMRALKSGLGVPVDDLIQAERDANKQGDF